MQTIDCRQESLSRARNCLGSTMNYGPILEGFTAKGIPLEEIEPRVNVFTFNAWLALGRAVRKGEHGVRITVFVPMRVKDKGTANEDGSPKVKSVRGVRAATVFHISQTDPIQEGGR